MSIKKLFLIVIAASTVFAGACSTGQTVDNSNVVTVNSPTPETIQTPANINTNTNLQAAESKPESSCADLKRKGYALDKKQTFALDFAPFEKSCFATFHDPEFTNPALGAQYFIYRNGAEIFSFPEQFNGGNASCWVDAVSFEDVNADNLKDIIIVGKCGGKTDAYNENMVYINTGKDFKVNKDANMEMMDYTKTGQIKEYIREHQESFAK